MKDYRTLALESLMNKAVSDRADALTSLSILLDHPAGIGDHSTSDLHTNLNESLSNLTDAEDRIETLKKHFPHDFQETSNTPPPFYFNV